MKPQAEPAPSALAGRRRTLAVEESPAANHHYQDAAPLPGGQPQILDVTEFDFTQAEAGPQSWAAEFSELDLGDFPSDAGARAPAQPVPHNRVAPVAGMSRRMPMAAPLLPDAVGQAVEMPVDTVARSECFLSAA